MTAHETPKIDPASAHSLATALLGNPVMPVDFLVEHLRHDADASPWIRHALIEICEAALPLPRVDIHASVRHPGGTADVIGWLIELDCEMLDRIRSRAVVLYGAAARIEERNQALMAYALAVAVGLSQHGVLLTNQPRREIDLMLAELAATAPIAFASILDQALLREAGC